MLDGENKQVLFVENNAVILPNRHTGNFMPTKKTNGSVFVTAVCCILGESVRSSFFRCVALLVTPKTRSAPSRSPTNVEDSKCKMPTS